MSMIPKVIHYCWFGGNDKNELIQKCLASWREHCPSFEIKEWNESNFRVDDFPFTKKMYAQKKWAFVSDYARLHILAEHGGFYLDTDMLLLRSLSPLCEHECVLGEEESGIISAGMIGAIPHHPFIDACKTFYNGNETTVITIPRALSAVFKDYPQKDALTVLPPQMFYPFTSETIHTYRGEPLGDDVYGVHLWNYSWGHPLNKFFKKIGVYRVGKRITEILGIKKLIKKLLGFI